MIRKRLRKRQKRKTVKTHPFSCIKCPHSDTVSRRHKSSLHIPSVRRIYVTGVYMPLEPSDGIERHSGTEFRVTGGTRLLMQSWNRPDVLNGYAPGYLKQNNTVSEGKWKRVKQHHLWQSKPMSMRLSKRGYMQLCCRPCRGRLDMMLLTGIIWERFFGHFIANGWIPLSGSGGKSFLKRREFSDLWIIFTSQTDEEMDRRIGAAAASMLTQNQSVFVKRVLS